MSLWISGGWLLTCYPGLLIINLWRIETGRMKLEDVGLLPASESESMQVLNPETADTWAKNPQRK